MALNLLISGNLEQLHGVEAYGKALRIDGERDNSRRCAWLVQTRIQSDDYGVRGHAATVSCTDNACITPAMPHHHQQQ